MIRTACFMAAALVAGATATAQAQSQTLMINETLRPEWCVRGSEQLANVYRRVDEGASFERADFNRGDCDPDRGYISDVIFRSGDRLVWQVSFTGWMIECRCDSAR